MWKVSVVVALGLGCASGGPRGPTFEYQPSSSPARYLVESTNSILIDTPMGLQESGDSSRATVSIVIGDPRDGGRDVTVTYEDLTIWLTGAASGTTRGGDLLDRPLTGVLAPTGRIEFAAEIPPVGSFDPGAALADFLVPMPEEGNTAEPWSISRTTTSSGQFDITSTFEGTGRIVGDTIWHGRSATLIRIDGDVTQNGSGQPAEAPAPIEFTWTGTATSTYVWDHMAGVMLAAVSMAELSGPLVLVGFDMTMAATVEGNGTVELIQ
jgi:hypothetical protein